MEELPPRWTLAQLYRPQRHSSISKSALCAELFLGIQNIRQMHNCRLQARKRKCRVVGQSPITTFIKHLRRIHIPCSYRNPALLGRRRLSKCNLCCTLIRGFIRGLHGRQPSMASLGFDNDGACRCWFWNLASPSRLRRSRLCLDRCISLAWTAVRSLVHCSRQGSVRRHTSLDFNVATPSPVNRMPTRCDNLCTRSLFVAVVARAVASWSCFRSFRLACVGSGDD